ncbi:MAG: hypothetical protein M3301_02265, partial [Chloroflexota bacterium]|nr:hypothetical protein [Chloroflexota bacterium]
SRTHGHAGCTSIAATARQGSRTGRVEWAYIDEHGEERTEGETCTHLVKTLVRPGARAAGERLTRHYT